MVQNRQYDPEMPCNKKGCSASVRESCCGCPKQLEYERQKKTRQMMKVVTSFWDEAIQHMRKDPGLYRSDDPEMPCNKKGCGLAKMFCDGCEEQMEYQKQHPEMRKMSMDEINARNKATAEAYGEDIIAECLIEECSELIQAVSKYRRACGNGKPTKVSVQKDGIMFFKENTHVSD